MTHVHKNYGLFLGFALWPVKLVRKKKQISGVSKYITRVSRAVHYRRACSAGNGDIKSKKKQGSCVKRDTAYGNGNITQKHSLVVDKIKNKEEEGV